MATHSSSRWIADAALHTLEHVKPSLTLVYLPHLDYDHQRFGPDDPIPWRFPWGLWIVNAVVRSNHIPLDGAGWEKGTPGEGGSFEPLPHTQT